MVPTQGDEKCMLMTDMLPVQSCDVLESIVADMYCSLEHTFSHYIAFVCRPPYIAQLHFCSTCFLSEVPAVSLVIVSKLN
jgi:hypothetical protein